MAAQTVRRGTTEERDAIDEAVLTTIERLTSEGKATSLTVLSYELATKCKRSHIDRSLQRLAIAEKIIFFPQLRGWLPMRLKAQGEECVAAIDAKERKKNWTDRKGDTPRVRTS